MDKSNVSIEEIKEKTLGQEVCYIGVGYGGYLKFGLGKKVYYTNKELKKKYHGECDVASRNCTWRISREKFVLCGDKDEPEYIDKKLSSIELGSVIDLRQNETCDLSIVFDSGISIDYFMNSTYEPQLHIIISNVAAYELTEDGFFEIDFKDLSRTYSDIESVINAHTKECCTRWSNLVEKSKSDQFCDNCFYFHLILGTFYFWRFGLCGNMESEYDGKLVGHESGCKKHKIFSDIKLT